MIAAAQIEAAPALLGIDQRHLAEASGLALSSIQRMGASDGPIRGNVGSLVKLIDVLDTLGVDAIGDSAVRAGAGRKVRLKGRFRRAGMRDAATGLNRQGDTA